MPIGNNEARLAVTIDGAYGELPDPVSFDAPDEQIRTWATEAVRSGGIPGIAANPNALFEDFIIDRQAAVDSRPYNRLELRPKTPFGERTLEDHIAVVLSLTEVQGDLCRHPDVVERMKKLGYSEQEVDESLKAVAKDICFEGNPGWFPYPEDEEHDRAMEQAMASRAS